MRVLKNASVPEWRIPEHALKPLICREECYLCVVNWALKNVHFSMQKEMNLKAPRYWRGRKMTGGA